MKSKEKGTAVSLCLCCTLGGSCLGSAGGQDVGEAEAGREAQRCPEQSGFMGHSLMTEGFPY